MHDFKQIHAVEARIKSFIALIIGRAVQHAFADPAIVVTMQQFPEQEEIRFQAVTECPQFPQELRLQAISHIEPQPVNIKLLDPATDAREQIVPDLSIIKVQLDQIVISFPAFIPETVMIRRITLEIQIEPVTVAGSLPMAQHILKCPEAAAGMIEHAIDHDAYPFLMQMTAKPCEVLIGSQPAVDLLIVAGIIAMGITFKHR